jgi:DNA-binding MarR family transcriptional regulator
MTEDAGALAAAVFAELYAVEHLTRARLGKALPRGLAISQFSVLNHLARLGAERTPAQLAHSFHVTRAAMTNTLSKLQAAGYVHIRPDWDDARQKLVAISPAGRAVRDQALDRIGPVLESAVTRAGTDIIRASLPGLKALRGALDQE